MIALFSLVVLLAQTVQPPPMQQNVAPVTAPPAPFGIPPLAGIDKIFALAAAESNAAEMAMAALAVKRSHTPEVVSFANKMLTEHMQLGDSLAPALQRVLGMPPPKTLSPGDQLTYRHLQTVSDVDFDQAYLLAQIAGHLAALGAFQTEDDNGTDAQLKMMARKWTPTIQAHLELAVEETKHVGGDSPFKSH